MQATLRIVEPVPDGPPGVCMAPGCPHEADPAGYGVCAVHRQRELAAVADADMLLALDVELERCRDEQQQRERAALERVAAIRRERERTTWGASRQLHERRVDGVLRAILQGLETDIGGGRSRNESLAAAAWASGRLVAGGEVPHDRARDELLAVGIASGLSEHEARGVIRRRFAAATKAPRMLEERRAA